MRDRLTDLGYAAAWRLVRALPLPLARAAFFAAADRAAAGRGPGAQRLERNLARVAPPGADLAALTRAGLRSYARYWLQAFRLPSTTAEQRRTGFVLVNADVLAAAVADGRGVVVALPHAGNWDAAGAWVAAQGWGITTVAERLKPAALFDRFVAFRESLGMEILPLTGAARPPLDVLAERLGQGHVVPLLADRDLSSRGVEVVFLGGRTRMPPGPALLALRTGAPLFAVDMWFEGEVPHAALRGPIAVPGPDEGPLDQRARLVTQRVADALAAGIAAHPEDWHMLQKVWLTSGAEPAGAAPAAAEPPAPVAAL
ncbi:phosphatidylinositol mannoside acyltransferase [Spirilliplanes yamanashiensis]|uniref:Lipid A biosynthesis lauroyl acyltransferase n=1 Tax=Spirilliplanes yamanashiensis TaxID=42233 RepID=A0A8J3YCB2_9ACTN|nr:phosphatidylinositol mannoside acyltransferase [Spirilliplanes yamanashiensis]MDP9818683.1 KDO2-lipid IV(A) lauroyltransferase [Spirilliplanes yamanashiensis]GIJ05140.1 lipid A biosynthesis lauroyl acyltransferase [Spirilliplanes yamanashiensis]